MKRSLAYFKSKLSDSFYSKIAILDNIIGSRHWLTTGTFKEKVIISYLRNTLPDSLSVKSGFVAFPIKKPFTGSKPKAYDDLNSSSFELSRQIDVVIYDSHQHPTIYEDPDIAIVMPEAVRGIIEVKGVLDHAHLNDATDALIDFGLKWKNYLQFRDNFHLDGKLVQPGLYQYFWDVKVDKTGKRKLGPVGHRKKIAKKVAEAFSKADLENVPMPRHSSLYGTYEICGTYDANDPEIMNFSYMTSRGQYVVFSDEGIPSLAGDRTLASVARDILCTSGMLTNRLLIDPDETANIDVLPVEDSGSSVVFADI